MIYLDNNATTQVAETVREAMAPWLGECYGNPSSTHRFGQEARQAVEEARVGVAGLLGCEPREVVFTSGGTEADNAAVFGVVGGRAAGRILTTSVEHSAVREPLAWLRKRSWEVTEVPVDELGRLDMPRLEQELQRGGVRLVTIIWANNETGVVFDVPRIAALARAAGAVMHCDGVQGVGKFPVGVRELGVDLMSVSAHKFHGPKGIGALYVRRGVERGGWEPWMRGGPQERDRRGGTENVAGVVGMGVAAEAARAFLAEGGWRRVAGLRDRLERGILERMLETYVNGDILSRVPNTTNIGFAGLEAEAILLLLSEREICASAGAACSSGSLEPSHVLRAMGVAERVAHGAVRFSLSRYTSEAEVDKVLEILPGVIARLRAVLPV